MHCYVLHAVTVIQMAVGLDEGDLMKSIYLLMYKAEEGVLEIRAKDFHSNYMTAVDILDDDTYLGAEINYNLFTVRKNSDAASDEDRNRLEVLSLMYTTTIFGLGTPKTNTSGLSRKQH